MTAREHADFNARQQALLEAGWHLIRFSNHEVRTDRDGCRYRLERALPHAPSTAPQPTSAPPPSAEHRTGVRPSRRSVRGKAIPLTVAAAVIGAGIVLVLRLASDGDSAPRQADPVGDECPADFPVKGNVSESGELIFHEPGWTLYARMVPEQCLADAASASNAGYRASESR